MLVERTLQAYGAVRGSVRAVRTTQWTLPEEGWCKLNTDGAKTLKEDRRQEHLCSLLLHIRLLLQRNWEVHVVHVLRSANSVADRIAKLATPGPTCVTYLANPPPSIEPILQGDIASHSVSHDPLYVKLANTEHKILREGTNKNQDVVLALYYALNTRDVDTVHQILAPDIEWWFHGPPSYQFMMHLLTGASSDSDHSFHFEVDPLSLTTFGSTVIVEGCDHKRSISWVHAWTFTDGIITQVREYFNTSLTVTRLGNPSQSPPSSYDSSSPSGSSSTAEITPVYCVSVWESRFSNRVGKSVPGLVLAI
ncbi:hypothetical protein V6N12_053205 [Hibiscus sabdariffa]|uniref:RNase H type-1 domain-containing protein n=1 Tax=Hibiscus sabdariffa TaxID=183260 RepID=A0ABR2D6W0_9ROSI